MAEMREFIEGYIKKRKLSLSKFAVMLGYKSKTSIERIMDGESGPETMYKFELAMKQTMELSPDEVQQLNEVTRLTVLGYQAFNAERAMWRFLCNERESAAAPLLEDVDTGLTQQIRERYAGKASLRITLFNCAGIPIFEALKDLLQAGASIAHYICIDTSTERTIKMIHTLMPVLYEKKYMCFILDETKRETLRSVGMARADVMLCRYTDENGQACEDVVTFSTLNIGRLMFRISSEDTFARWLGVACEEYRPFKQVFKEYADAEGYLEYSAAYTALEENRSIWKLKPDVGIDYIPLDILDGAMKEGPMRDEPELELFFKLIRPVYEKRFHNTVTKRKPVFTVFKKNAMLKFAQTGKASDHFWGMRPFTPAERIRIFEHLLTQLRRNPYFNLFFLKDDDAIRDAEIACYDNVGVLVLNHETNYDLANSHGQVMIKHPEFMRLFQHFFMDTLLKQYVLSNAETEAFFLKLIDVCKKR